MGHNSTPQTRAVIGAARNEASGRGQQLEPSHLLLAIIQTQDSGARQLIARFVPPESLESGVNSLISACPQSDTPAPPQKTPHSPASKRAIEHSISRVMHRDGRWRTSDILLGIVLDGQSNVAALLNSHGITAGAVEEHLASIDELAD